MFRPPSTSGPNGGRIGLLLYTFGFMGRRLIEPTSKGKEGRIGRKGKGGGCSQAGKRGYASRYVQHEMK